jgi:hypothetical protein
MIAYVVPWEEHKLLVLHDSTCVGQFLGTHASSWELGHAMQDPSSTYATPLGMV